MRSARFASAAPAALVLATAFALAAGDRPPAGDAELRAVADSLGRQERAIRSLYVRYRTTSRLIGSGEDVTRHLGVVALTSPKSEFAFKGDKRYYSESHTDSLAATSASLDSLAEPGRTISTPANRVVAFDGAVLRKRNAGGQTASIGNGTPGADDVGYFNPEYLGLTMRTLPDVLDVRNTRAENRLSGAIAAGLCTIRDARDTVEGVECAVLDVEGPFSITCWCDPSKGHVVVKQEGRYPDSRLLQWRTVCSDFVDLDGVWFPRKAVTERFAGPGSPKRLHDSPLLAYDLSVEEIYANTVPDELFALKIPPGTMVHDYLHGTDEGGTKVATSFAMPAGEQALEKTAAAVKLARQREGQAGGRSWLPILVAVNVGVLICVALAIVVRRGWARRAG